MRVGPEPQPFGQVTCARRKDSRGQLWRGRLGQGQPEHGAGLRGGMEDEIPAIGASSRLRGKPSPRPCFFLRRLLPR
ncbi:hypothetical protein J27TS7_22500 [Paenibacillus dendritiformis]|nr:hypothetical protein J27TS7_22500 [Paenibacillus dendritiformis]